MKNQDSFLKEGIVVAFDFGTKYIGVAIGQALTGTARPLTTIKAKNSISLWNEISSFVEEWNPSAFVVGIPLRMNETNPSITRQAKAFAKKLSHLYKLPTYEIDEHLTTVEAKEIVYQSDQYRLKGKTKQQIESDINSFAAKIILESWFREH